VGPPRGHYPVEVMPVVKDRPAGIPGKQKLRRVECQKEPSEGCTFIPSTFPATACRVRSQKEPSEVYPAGIRYVAGGNYSYVHTSRLPP
jgi:hypothetical protein